MTGSTPLPGRRVRGSASGRPIMALLDLLGRRWTLRVLWELSDDSRPTFRQLQRRCDDASSSVLSKRLRELGEAGLVEHTGDGYVLTGQGTALLGHLTRLDGWAVTWEPRRAAE
jgi:DNA-binding HxlR family transcriptional regulator